MKFSADIKKLGNAWGELKILSGMISLYVTGGTFLFGSITAYPVVSEWLHAKDIAIPFWQYFLAIILFILGILLLERKLSLPGYYRKSNELVWGNDNPMRKAIEKIQSENAELKKELAEVKSILARMSR